MEAEIADLDDEDKQVFLADMGLNEPGLDRVIRAGYALLGLQTYFTAGPKEVRAWTIHDGDTAPQAAGVIHTDFEKGFIRAEVIAYDDFIALQGRARREGGGQDAARGQGVRRPGRRRHALPLQRLSRDRRDALNWTYWELPMIDSVRKIRRPREGGDPASFDYATGFPPSRE